MQNRKYPYIIAEIGGNHNGDVELAKKMIDIAVDCGVDAVKFQLYNRYELATYDYLTELNQGKIKIENISNWSTKEYGLKSIFEQVDKYAIQEKEHIELFNYCREKKIDYASSALTKQRIDFLIEQDVSFLKIASCDINNVDFISYCFGFDLPVLISTGLASLGEIEKVVNVIPKDKKKNAILLHCTSLYPPKESEVNLNFIKALKDIFELRVGYSDHTIGFSVPLAAVALGAMIVEKHFTLDKNMPGWDHKVSANPEEIKIICDESKKIFDSLGERVRVLSQREYEKRFKFRRSAVTVKALEKGSIISKNDIVYKRPGNGIAPSEEQYLIGRKLKHSLAADKTINWEDLV